jgi:serine/tyrosine/threonine adenylyltransferase
VTTTLGTFLFSKRFATELPELALEWQGEEAPNPRLLLLNDRLASELGVDTVALGGSEGLRLLTGTLVPLGATPVAQAYAGHQFGGYTPRLGDGRALLVGELTDREGRSHDLHLKGSGPTPFSRGGDGRAAVGPMVREYVVSGAMHALGVPTTRALAVIGTGRQVRRESVLPGAVLARVASSHLRVGTFQYAASTGDLELVRRLADHAMERHHPSAATAEHPYRALFEAVVAAQADLVARWMLIGFVHGVMNTDNMTISGETIDYGPCAFMEAYDTTAVYSSIDVGGRYAYGNQPAVAQWNLARFAEAILPLFSQDQARAVTMAEESLSMFRHRYSATYLAGLRAKLGLPAAVENAVVAELAEELLELLRSGHVDWTSGFRALGAAARGGTQPVGALFLDPTTIEDWLARWRALGPDPALMDRTNPAYIPRNHLVEEALDAATNGDLDPVQRLLQVVQHPFEERPGLERYAEPAPQDFGRYTTYCGT